MKRYVATILATIIVYLIMVGNTLLASDTECVNSDVECFKLLTKLCIDKDIKTVHGWRRVCNNNKLILYTCSSETYKPIVYLLNEACNCLVTGDINDNTNMFYIFKEDK